MTSNFLTMFVIRTSHDLIYTIQTAGKGIRTARGLDCSSDMQPDTSLVVFFLLHQVYRIYIY